jgi:protein-disulfide isomerase
MWIDFQCPICKEYEATNGQMLQQKVKSGDVTLTVHPLTFLDDNLHNGSSKLAANAFACATEEGSEKAMAFALAVYKAQPEEQAGQEAWSTDDLISIGNDVGIQGDQWDSCVQNGTYDDWVQQVEASQQDKGVTGTPTVFVDGQQLRPTDDLQAAIASASGSS